MCFLQTFSQENLYEHKDRIAIKISSAHDKERLVCKI
jgi:hypothetical protein